MAHGAVLSMRMEEESNGREAGIKKNIQEEADEMGRVIAHAQIGGCDGRGGGEGGREGR